MLNVPAYLDRIAYTGPISPTLDVLRNLHRHHMLSVPFENLDIALGRNIVCEEDSFTQKIVERRRGGFCYELNGTFASLLRAIGFKVTLLSARVSRDDGSQSPEFDHLALRIDLEEPWLADVGFGDSFLEPLQLQPRRRAGTGWLDLSCGGVRGLVLDGESGPRWDLETAIFFHFDTAKSRRFCGYVPLSSDFA